MWPINYTIDKKITLQINISGDLSGWWGAGASKTTFHRVICRTCCEALLYREEGVGLYSGKSMSVNPALSV